MIVGGDPKLVIATQIFDMMTPHLGWRVRDAHLLKGNLQVGANLSRLQEAVPRSYR